MISSFNPSSIHPMLGSYASTTLSEMILRFSPTKTISDVRFDFNYEAGENTFGGSFYVYSNELLQNADENWPIAENTFDDMRQELADRLQSNAELSSIILEYDDKIESTDPHALLIFDPQIVTELLEVDVDFGSPFLDLTLGVPIVCVYESTYWCSF